ncbi:MAG: hypothetical protein LUC93_12100 [Planctomycetaceae bacterium]|nr:hypothetical protein [Planctomycetaceae bacterium]
MAGILRRKLTAVVSSIVRPGPVKKIPPRPNPEPASTPMAFGYKTVWMAVPSGDREEVALALGFRKLEWMIWSDGLGKALEYFSVHVAVLPPMHGWVIVVGDVLPTPDLDNPLFHTISRRFGEVQAFANHRVSDFYAWARWRDGKLVRRVVYGDEMIQVGDGEWVEEDILTSTTGDEGWVHIDEEDVHTVAREWSFSPLDIEDDPPNDALLLVGKLTKG